MLKDLAIAFAEAAGLKALVPRLAKLAKTALAVLMLGVFFAVIGIVTTFYLLFRLAVKPLPAGRQAPQSQLDQINSRLDKIESQQYNP